MQLNSTPNNKMSTTIIDHYPTVIPALPPGKSASSTQFDEDSNL